jgi:phytanoyl-CoA hydroxylase
MGGHMHTIMSPIGTTASIPAVLEEDQAYFTLKDLAEASTYYAENGYVVFRNLVDKALCRKTIELFDRHVGQFSGYIYRQTTSFPEKNVVNEQGFVMNPVLNFQDLPAKDFAPYRDCAIDVITTPNVQTVLNGLFGVPGIVVQTMHFQGNTATPSHQDTYYLDAETLGLMAAGWFALEDIMPGAGRFYVYPGSHKIDIASNGGDFDVAFHHDRYLELIKKIIRERQLEMRAPFLAAGDVLFWNAKTIHGSLETNQAQFSRSSLTAHYIPSNQRFLQYQARIKPLHLVQANGMAVNKPKDLDTVRNRLEFEAAVHMPGLYRMAKKLAVKAVTR